jgi:hypothetical protein
MEPTQTRATHLVHQTEAVITHMQVESHVEVFKNFSTIQNKSPIPLS